ncbi:histone-fold-containing protein [Rickenella mellea]|uniref:DNA polymerase epsilon subunit D n=1 Tax=Rickenella mellea TaxID=50990 RepID=A0A4Y7PQL5_9AGAM|nr:histone-fold-containing protein [Rickenella mellea]
MPRKDSATAQPTAQAQQEAASDGIDNYELPKSVVTRIAKSALPENAKLQKDTVLALVKGSTVFINYLAATAHDMASSRQHKSVSASDVLKALELIQFGDMVDGLQEELKVYREVTKNSKKGKASGATSANGKGKGKERATSPSGQGVDASESASTAPETTQSAARAGSTTPDDDEEMEDVRADADDPEAEQLEDDPELEDDELMDDGGPDGEAEDDDGEPLVDRMALEEEELRVDAKKANLDNDDAGDAVG